MIQSEVVMDPYYIPHGNNRYAVEQTTARTIYHNVPACVYHQPEAVTNRFQPFDEDPLTPEELADLDESYRDLKEGRYKVLSKDLSDEEFLANF